VAGFAVRAGLVLAGEGLEPLRDACVHVDDGVIVGLGSAASCPLDRLGSPSVVVVPQPGLAHVHSADHAFPEAGYDLRLDALVAPPGGLKHRLLARASAGELVEAIREFYTLAWRLGVGLLVDFREGGGEGCALAKRAASEAPEGLTVAVLGRPGPGFPGACDGVGLPSPLDYELRELERLASIKPSMVHVAETPATRQAGDLELALRAGFDAIVHGTFLSPGDLEALATAGTGLVLCPRSNMWHGLGAPPAHAALATEGLRVALGSDNGAWTPPNPWREAETLLLVARAQGGPSGEGLARRILESMFVEPYRLVGERPRVVEEGAPARFLVFDAAGWGLGREASPAYWALKRLGGENLKVRVDDGELAWV